MILSSRPLRFLGIVIGGWIGMRVAMLWPAAREAMELPGRAIAAEPEAMTVAAVVPPRIPARGTPLREARPAPSLGVLAAALDWRASRVGYSLPDTAADGPMRRLEDVRPGSALPEIAPGIFPLAAPVSPYPSRWSGSAWAIVRPAGPAAPFAGQLGGSQAGVRVAYSLDRHLAIVGRVAGALAAPETQVALGVEWRPGEAPVRLFVEQRVAVNGGRGGPVAGVIGGFGPTPVGRRIVAEGYGQAGMIARDGVEGFVEGAARLSTPLGVPGRVRVDLGAGAWGGAQREAARLDLGPSLSASLPVAERRVRISLDWRERVAGRARPGSGAALTLGADF